MDPDPAKRNAHAHLIPHYTFHLYVSAPRCRHLHH